MCYIVGKRIIKNTHSLKLMVGVIIMYLPEFRVFPIVITFSVPTHVIYGLRSNIL